MTQKRRRFTPAEKAAAVRKHLRDRTPVSQIADEMRVQPTMIHNWVNCVLSQAERAFESGKQVKRTSQTQDAQLAELKASLTAKNAVIAGLAERIMNSAIPDSPFDVCKMR